MGFLRRYYKQIFLAVFIIAGLAAALWLVSYNYAHESLRDDSLGQRLGPADADIAIIEVIDYRCPVCRAVDPEVQKFISQHDNVKVIHKHFPAFGDQSVFEAQIALAAGIMGRYEDVHNYLISQSNPVTPGQVEKMGAELNLDLDELYKHMNSDRVHNAIRSNALSVVRYGVKSTPSFIIANVVHDINGPVPTAADFDYLLRQLEKEGRGEIDPPERQ